MTAMRLRGTCEDMSRLNQLREWWVHAFAIADDGEISPEEEKLAERLADWVVRRRLIAPALMFLEGSRPFTFVGSQVLAFLAPLATLVFSQADYERLLHLLEKRHSVDLLVGAIEKQEGAQHE